MSIFPVTLRRQGNYPTIPAAPRWWRRLLVDPVLGQLRQGITPEKISLSLAIGGLCAFFPLLGAATPLCILAGITLRLNQAVIQIVNGVTSPLYPVVVFGLLRLGDRLLGPTHASMVPGAMLALLRHAPLLFLSRCGPLIGHALLGWIIVAPLWVILCHLCLLPILKLVSAHQRLPAIRLPAG
jgi:uncharacterized protein (DUF2062 family)